MNADEKLNSLIRVHLRLSAAKKLDGRKRALLARRLRHAGLRRRLFLAEQRLGEVGAVALQPVTDAAAEAALLHGFGGARLDGNVAAGLGDRRAAGCHLIGRRAAARRATAEENRRAQRNRTR